MRRVSLPTFLLILALVVPATAAARPVVGIGDQHPLSFRDPGMRKLKLKTARLALSWDWYKQYSTRSQLDNWMGEVRAAQLRPLIVFNRSWRHHSGRRKVPSLKSYVKSFKEFRKAYPYVRDFSAWNEPNAPEQPFYRKPALAATYHNALRRACRRCTIVAGDVNDGKNFISYVSKYKKRARGVKVWGLHNYKDATVKRGTTRVFLRLVRGPVWLTETGGLTNRGGVKGQAKAVKRIFSLARSSRRIKRIYFYQWRRTPGRWDSAFVAKNGKRRPAYYTLRKAVGRRR
jgi:hypothetical protein